MLSSYANCIANFAVGDQRLKGQSHRCLIFLLYRKLCSAMAKKTNTVREPQICQYQNLRTTLKLNICFIFVSETVNLEPITFPNLVQNFVKIDNKLRTKSFNNTQIETENRICVSLKFYFYFRFSHQHWEKRQCCWTFTLYGILC